MDCLRSEYKLTRDQALDTPVREALCEHAVIALRHGWTWACDSYAKRDLGKV